jgi:hypothetical protein
VGKLRKLTGTRIISSSLKKAAPSNGLKFEGLIGDMHGEFNLWKYRQDIHGQGIDKGIKSNMTLKAAPQGLEQQRRGNGVS